MGITQHRHGVDTVRAIVNLALARGSVGRPAPGLMPIRGHSRRAGRRRGAARTATASRAGAPIDAANARASSSALWGFDVPSARA